MSSARDMRLRRRDMSEHGVGDRRDRCAIGVGKGLGKRAYSSGNQAKRAASELSFRYSKILRPYLCACGQWHLTSQEKM